MKSSWFLVLPGIVLALKHEICGEELMHIETCKDMFYTVEGYTFNQTSEKCEKYIIHNGCGYSGKNNFGGNPSCEAKCKEENVV
ncbi:uncharacterized protein DMAD_13398 [Drosophila madeirensis]|uniref:BPTI/Kunitz inhibitor domain-containing protein n=1 Tax=Drosophila madeirensis TaxID=30013 RepID=A0AAU9FK53_DROMD